MYTIIDKISDNPVFNVMASDGRTALLCFLETRNLHADYCIECKDGVWEMTNAYGSRFIAIESISAGNA